MTFKKLISVAANNVCTERSLLDNTVENFQNSRTASLVNKETCGSGVLETHQQCRLQSHCQSAGAVVTNLVVLEKK